MTAKDLKNVRQETQSIVEKYLAKTGKSITGLAKEAKIHPAQLLLFMRGDRGLTDTSMSRIGEVITNNKK
tara:strand:+ start:278 stop:487 length:210 start_codon:yes stop_codon:yes gene_type:complete